MASKAATAVTAYLMGSSKATEVVAVQLRRRDCLMLAKMVRNARRKAERAVARSHFVPEPGRRNAQEVYAERYGEMERYLLSFVREVEL